MRFSLIFPAAANGVQTALVLLVGVALVAQEAMALQPFARSVSSDFAHSDGVPSAHKSQAEKLAQSLATFFGITSAPGQKFDYNSDADSADKAELTLVLEALYSAAANGNKPAARVLKSLVKYDEERVADEPASENQPKSENSHVQHSSSFREYLTSHPVFESFAAALAENPANERVGKRDGDRTSPTAPPNININRAPESTSSRASDEADADSAWMLRARLFLENLASTAKAQLNGDSIFVDQPIFEESRTDKKTASNKNSPADSIFIPQEPKLPQKSQASPIENQHRQTQSSVWLAQEFRQPSSRNLESTPKVQHPAKSEKHRITELLALLKETLAGENVPPEERVSGGNSGFSTEPARKWLVNLSNDVKRANPSEKAFKKSNSGSNSDFLKQDTHDGDSIIRFIRSFTRENGDQSGSYISELFNNRGSSDKEAAFFTNFLNFTSRLSTDGSISAKKIVDSIKRAIVDGNPSAEYASFGNMFVNSDTSNMERNEQHQTLMHLFDIANFYEYLGFKNILEKMIVSQSGEVENHSDESWLNSKEKVLGTAEPDLARNPDSSSSRLSGSCIIIYYNIENWLVAIEPGSEGKILKKKDAAEFVNQGSGSYVLFGDIELHKGDRLSFELYIQNQSSEGYEVNEAGMSARRFPNQQFRIDVFSPKFNDWFSRKPSFGVLSNLISATTFPATASQEWQLVEVDGFDFDDEIVRVGFRLVNNQDFMTAGVRRIQVKRGNC